MGEEMVLFSSEERRQVSEVADFLRELANKLQEGQVILRQGDSEVPLTIPKEVVLEIKAEEETKGSGKIKRSLEIEIEWVPGEESLGGVTLG